MDAKRLYRLKHVADLSGVALGTLRSAITRGEIPTYPTACGLPLCALRDVMKWKQAPRRPPGRPPQTDTEPTP